MKLFTPMRMRYHQNVIFSNLEDIDEITRRHITRVCNCISALANRLVPVSEYAIRRALEASNVYTNLADLLLPGISPDSASLI